MQESKEPKQARPAEVAAQKDPKLEEQAEAIMQEAAAKREQSKREQAAAQAAPTTPANADEAHAQKLKGVQGRCSVLSVCCVLLAAAVLGGGFYGYQEINALKQAQSTIANEAQALSDATQALNQAQQQIATLMQSNQDLQQHSAQFLQAQDELAQQVQDLVATQGQERDALAKMQAQLKSFSARDPNAWRIAESYFQVAEAYRQTAYARNPKAAIWNLQQADALLVNIEDENILALRQAIAADLSTLQAVQLPDLMGIALRLEQMYQDVANLVLAGMSDPKQRAAAFEQQQEPSDSLADWKENLLTSAKEFSSRFVEIRRRAPDAAEEFLSPQQETYLRENIRTRLLLAKLALTQGSQAEYVANLNAAATMVNAYFAKEHALTQATLESLEQLQAQQIDLNMPRVLKSHQLFEKLASTHIQSLQG